MKRIISFLLTTWLASAVFAADPPEGETETLFPQQLSAKGLIAYCASSSITQRGRQQQRYCAGFVSGVEESLRLLRMNSPENSYSSLCVPANITARNFQEVYIRYAGRSGTDLNRPAVLVAVEALQAAFPCQPD